MDMSRKAVIIGAGIGGLASAIRLAVQEFEVTVFEKNSQPGGKLGHFELDGFGFDEGPSLFTQPALLEELFALAGEPMEEYFTYQTEEVCCHYFYEDGTQINAYANSQLFDEELVTKNGENAGALSNYLRRSVNMYNQIGKVFLEYSLHKKETLLRAPVIQALKATKWPYLFHTMNRMNSDHFKNPKTIQLFNRYATYNGSNPYKAPGMLNLIPHLEHTEGVFYPRGGMVSIASSLYKLALKKGVTFHFDTPVERIIYAGSHVAGVVVNKKNWMANVIVSNIDVYFTYRNLLRQPLKAKKILRQERSSSAIVFYWGINKEFPNLGLHNIFFSGDYQKEFEHLFQKKKMYNDPTVYVNITAKKEPGIHAPKGKENWFVMVNTPANTGQNWPAFSVECRKWILDKLSRTLQVDLANLIEQEAIMDPVLIESKTASYMGSLYGTSSNSKMAAFLRHPNFSKAIRGLYFVGGSVHPGGGLPLCLHSAKIMSEMVLRDEKTNHMD